MTEAEMTEALVFFNVTPTAETLSLIIAINHYHQGRRMVPTHVEPLRALCGESAIPANTETKDCK